MAARLLEHQEAILKDLNKADAWRQVHKALAEYDAGIKKRGNGLVFHNLKDKQQTMKASSLDRSCSLKEMEKRLGKFEPPRKGHEKITEAPKHKYEAKPLLNKHPYSSQLWRKFLTTRQAIPKTTLFGRTKANWKLFLMTEAHADPLAMVLLIAHQEMLHMIFGPGGKMAAPIPKTVLPALASLMPTLMKGEQKPSTEGKLIKPTHNKNDDLIGLIVLDENRKGIMALGKTAQKPLKKKKEKAPYDTSKDRNI